MTQESDRRLSSTHRHSHRSSRNKPVLITSAENGEIEASMQDSGPTRTDVQQIAVVEPSAPARSHRLPSFFSTVGKSAQKETSQDIDATSARLARASRSKPSTSSTSKPASEAADGQKSATQQANTPARTGFLSSLLSSPPARVNGSGRPASAFKTRYLIGMGLYLLFANFIGYYETSFLQAYHLNGELTRFSLFGSVIPITPATILFLATLIIILVLLAHFDLIPRNFASLSGRPSAKSTSSKGQNTSENGNGARNAPLTMRQGVKGKDDDLYQEYRANQRRERKK